MKKKINKTQEINKELGAIAELFQTYHHLEEVSNDLNDYIHMPIRVNKQYVLKTLKTEKKEMLKSIKQIDALAKKLRSKKYPDRLMDNYVDLWTP